MMATLHQTKHGDITQKPPQAHAWEMVSAFMLSLPEKRSTAEECTLEPIASALRPLGLDDRLLCEISAEVEKNGEDLRGCCQEGKLDCVNVRVNVSSQALRRTAHALQPWSFYVIKQMASSESDNLDAMENPRCFIDLYVYPAE
jgi:hypothetical protein